MKRRIFVCFIFFFLFICFSIPNTIGVNLGMNSGYIEENIYL